VGTASGVYTQDNFGNTISRRLRTNRVFSKTLDSSEDEYVLQCPVQ